MTPAEAIKYLRENDERRVSISIPNDVANIIADLLEDMNARLLENGLEI